MVTALPVYATLDEWWGEMFGYDVMDRVNLPYDQAQSLYEHCSNYTIPALDSPQLSTYKLHPVLSPWILEAEEVVFAGAQARQSIDLLSGSPNTMGYAFFRYTGAFKFRLEDDTLRQIGDYGLTTSVDSWPLMLKKLKTIHTLALYAHSVLLLTNSILPAPPQLERDAPREAWLTDVRHRLSLLAILRPLHDTGAISIGSSPAGAEAVTQFEGVDAQNLLLREDEAEEFMEGLTLIRDDEAPDERVLRQLMANAIALPHVSRALMAASLVGAQPYVDKASLKRILQTLLATVTARPADKFLNQWVQLQLPIPDSENVPNLLSATYRLRKDSQLFSDWQASVSESLAAAVALTSDNAPPEEIRQVFQSTLAPKVFALRHEVSRSQQLRRGVAESTAALGIGGVGVLGVAAVGGATLDAAAVGVTGAVGAGLLALLRAARAPHSSNLASDAYLSLGFPERQ